ncbi:MAG: cobalamin-independent methionine synthase II family protein [Thaumarchaeota archaeon]|nr:cobalamin-independent methionine synthase II family protein [Candidatus Calditenuaceae archaeon]MDW8041949.1 cobalamin-independent methionine synthase II family protein [Nitrososphaerota archaeon]
MSESFFVTSVVGSWPRPNWLLAELRRKNKGELSYERFSEAADEAVLIAVKYQEDAGIDVLTDGEQRRDNFYSFVVDKLEGVKLMSVAELLDYVKDRRRFEEALSRLDVPAFAIKSPVVVGPIRKRRPLALDELAFLKEHTRRRIKVPLPGPYMLTRASWVEPLSRNAYWSREDLATEYVRILREEIIALADAGAHFVQLDEPTLMEVVYGDVSQQTFMCAAIMAKTDPKEELEFATELVNRTVKGVTGVRVGVHVCRGNWTKAEGSLLTGDYSPLIPYFQEMKVDQFVLEFATARAGEIKVFADASGVKELGLGVVNPRTDEVELSDFIKAKVREAVKYFDPDRIYLNPDCGFGTFAESPVNRAPVAYEKLKSMVKAAEELRKEFA